VAQDFLATTAEAWWKRKAEGFTGGMISASAASALARELANKIDCDVPTALLYAASSGVIGESLESPPLGAGGVKPEASKPKPEPLPVPQPGSDSPEEDPDFEEEDDDQGIPDPEGENPMPTHPDAGLSVKDFIRKYSAECDGGDVNLLLEKSTKLGRNTSKPSMASAKSLLKKEGFKFSSKSKDSPPPPPPESPKVPGGRGRASGKAGKKGGSEESIDTLIARLQGDIVALQSKLNATEADLLAAKRTKDLIGSKLG